MKSFALTFLSAAVFSVATLASAEAYNSSDLAAKVWEDRPNVGTGRTFNPTARPDSNGGLQRKIMQDHPGTNGGFANQSVITVDQGSLHDTIRLN